jgi:hypothetical protein
VQHDDRLTGGITDRGVMDVQLRQNVAGVELKILDDIIAFLRLGIVCCLPGAGSKKLSFAACQQSKTAEFHYLFLHWLHLRTAGKSYSRSRLSIENTPRPVNAGA